MKFRFFLLLWLVPGILQQVYAQEKTGVTIHAGQLKPYGRYALNVNHQLELISSASSFGVSFTGGVLTLSASLADEKGHNYLQYELDGLYKGRIRIEAGTHNPVVIKAGPGKHTIWIYKATEAHTGPVLISGITAGQAKPLTKAAAPLIEFIGNSITCGAASDPSDVPCGAGVYHDQHNAYMAYGPRLARALGTDFVLSSVSGIGVYRTWNQESPSMPQVYEKIDFQEKNPTKWDFRTYTPQIVSIALGTNDLSTGDGKNPRKAFSTQDFVQSYVNFVKLVKSKYPSSRIALLSSPMVKDSSGRLLEKCLSLVKADIDLLYPADKPVALFFFEPMEARGCGGHPSVEDHLMLSEQLTPFFSGLLKEKP
jgi:hypothetical protein